MKFAVPATERTTVPVVGSDAVFPVRRIYCVGRNYAEHAREMGGSPDKTPPCFFTKPADAIVADGSVIDYPQATHNLHYESELVAALASGGTDIAPGDVEQHIFGYAVGIDLTRRDLQKQAKDTGTPWDAGKAFDNAAPCSAVLPASASVNAENAGIWLKVNGEMRQSSNTSQMIWPIREIIAELSGLFELKAGDLVFTGTPEGVGPVVRGDQIEAGIEGVGELRISIR